MIHPGRTFLLLAVAVFASFMFAASGAAGSSQAAAMAMAAEVPTLSVSPETQNVISLAGTTTFTVSNTGTGTMPWTVKVITGGDWLTITSGSSGTDTGTITCAFGANTTTTSRTGTLRIRATDATDSPKDVSVTQEGAQSLSVTPSKQGVSSSSGTAIFSVSNTGAGTMSWTAKVTTGENWLLITSGASGTNSGTINCSITANTTTYSRSGSITVTAPGAMNSPQTLSVVQDGIGNGNFSPISETGQTKCYNNSGEITCPSPGQAFYGQDGNYTINPFSYTKLDGNGNMLPDSATSWVMVKDNVTDLTWEVKTNKDGVKNYNDSHDADNTYTWYDSNPATNGGDPGTPGNDTEEFIFALNDAKYGGYSDWRVPTIKELATIVNYSIPSPGPAIDNMYFPNTAASWYWSSTTGAGGTGRAWGVGFDGGGVNDASKDGKLYVRAVRGGQSVSLGNSVIGLLTVGNNGLLHDELATNGGCMDNGDGTVTDVSTGLMWQQDGSTNISWEQAMLYSENLSLAGHSDWRLPTVKELQSLIDYSRYNPAISTIYFPNTSASMYCSSTTNAYAPDNVWYVDFNYGQGYNHGYGTCDWRNCYYFNYKFNNFYVRAVRGGQSGSLGHLIILSPYQGGKWNIGTENNITWNPQDIAGNVAISISRDGGKTFTSIVEDTPNNGSYPWTVSGPASVNCMMKIEPLSDPSKVAVQGLFTVYQQPQPVLSVDPTHRDVSKDIGSTTFNVSNTGTGTMPWTAEVISSSWLTISSGSSGTDTGTITCAFEANTTTASRTGTIRITATGATGSPKEVTVTQEGVPSLSVSPTTQNVGKSSGTTTFNVSNTGTGSMPWTTEVISASWLTITSGNSGTDTGTITCAFEANTTTASRTGTIRITATGATGSPKEVMVTQECVPSLSVSPTTQNVGNATGTTTFSVSNTGTGTMPWTAEVISASWLTISSGNSGTDTGTITCAFEANTTTASRTGTIRITATGATGSPKEVTVTQEGVPSLSVSPTTQNVGNATGTTTFSVSNTGTGSMPWTAEVISSSWLSITSGSSGTDTGTINCAFVANTGTSPRTGSILVTSAGATGSPAEVTVTQAAAPASPVISGSVKTGNDTAISGVTITFSNGGGTAATDPLGNYTKTVAYGWSGTATPSLSGYTFNPVSKTYSNVTANQTDQDYTGSALSTPKFWGIWPDGVWSWNQSTKQWSKMALTANALMITAGDLDGDKLDDLIGVWYSGLWVRYSYGQWVRLSQTMPTWIAAGDLNNDGKDDVIGSWKNDSVYYRDSANGQWIKISSPAKQLAVGKLGGIRDDLIGVWNTGLWIRSSATGAWQNIDPAIPIWISSGDMTGSGRSDIVGSYGSGTWYWYSATGSWAKITTSAEQVTTGDLNGDGRDDLIGVWSDGVWVRYAVTNQWQKITASKPTWITTGRTADAIQSVGGIDDPDASDENVVDFSSDGPGTSVMNVENGSSNSLQNIDGRE